MLWRMNVWYSFVATSLVWLSSVSAGTSSGWDPEDTKYTTVPYADLLQPRSIYSVNGVLEETLSFEMTRFVSPDYSIDFRSFNASLTGLVFRIKAGDRILMNYTNNLPSVFEQNPELQQNEVLDEFCKPEETNLHFHGMVISGEEPSDDVVNIIIKPQEWYLYDTLVPDIHMPGTHWIHPHRHGSASLQIGAFAAATLIVEDPPGYLPKQVEEAREIIMMVQEVTLEQLSWIAKASNDTLFKFNRTYEGNKPPPYTWGDGKFFTIVNGQISPVIRLIPGEWVRLRVVSAVWNVHEYRNLGLQISGCEMRLLAKDGVYVQDYPRNVMIAPIPRGGRADIMLRCSFYGNSSYTILKNLMPMAYIERLTDHNDTVINSTHLEPWAPEYPSYLQDLLHVSASDGCRCFTNLTNPRSDGDPFTMINGVPFAPDNVLHTSYQGAVVERFLNSDYHAYHQHVYPFQLINRTEVTSCLDIPNCNIYYKEGDWQDTYEGTAIIRYQPNLYQTHVVLHCHIIAHEDMGMMSQEYVGSEGGQCACNGPAPVDTRVQIDAMMTKEPPIAVTASLRSTTSSSSDGAYALVAIFVVLIVIIAMAAFRTYVNDGMPSHYSRRVNNQEGYGTIEDTRPVHAIEIEIKK